jgi:5-(carboxyamino)imidazole ribonucleotide mutase
MPKGIPVATVAIDGSENAALLAIQILATGNENLYKKLIAYKKEMEIAIELKDAEIKKAVEEMK